jgi:regulatory protein
MKAQPTPEQALKKAESYCAYQERSQQEARDMLYSWGLHRNEVENILTILIGNGFLKEERFASAFAGGKFRIKKWGRNKIKNALKSKSVSDPLIKKALSEIDQREYEKVLKQVIAAKSRVTKETNPYKRKNKIAQYVISRGYEPELVWSVLGSNEEE